MADATYGASTPTETEDERTTLIQKRPRKFRRSVAAVAAAAALLLCGTALRAQQIVSLRQFVSLTIMLMILNTLQPEAPLYRRLLLCVCSVVVCMAEARTCDYFLTNKTSPRTPMKRHALQISGVMRTLGEAYPKMRRLLVLPNAISTTSIA